MEYTKKELNCFITRIQSLDLRYKGSVTASLLSDLYEAYQAPRSVRKHMSIVDMLGLKNDKVFTLPFDEIPLYLSLDRIQDLIFKGTHWYGPVVALEILKARLDIGK